MLYKPPPIFGSSPRGLITLTHQQKYFEIVKGEDERYEDWLDYVV